MVVLPQVPRARQRELGVRRGRAHGDAPRAPPRGSSPRRASRSTIGSDIDASMTASTKGVHQRHPHRRVRAPLPLALGRGAARRSPEFDGPGALKVNPSNRHKGAAGLVAASSLGKTRRLKKKGIGRKQYSGLAKSEDAVESGASHRDAALRPVHEF